MNVNKIVSDVIGGVDNVTTTEEEISKIGTERLKIDNNSLFALPALVRPILSFYYSLLFGYLLIYGMHKEALNYKDALLTIGGIVTAIIAFYFSWRGAQKISANKNEAAIKITELQTRAAIKENRKDRRKERKTENN
jgi:hypothetical protein